MRLFIIRAQQNMTTMGGESWGLDTGACSSENAAVSEGPWSLPSKSNPKISLHLVDRTFLLLSRPGLQSGWPHPPSPQLLNFQVPSAPVAPKHASVQDLWETLASGSLLEAEACGLVDFSFVF